MTDSPPASLLVRAMSGRRRGQLVGPGEHAEATPTGPPRRPSHLLLSYRLHAAYPAACLAMGGAAV